MDEHLIETFYITRPLPQPRYQDHLDAAIPTFPSESSTQHSIGQAQPLPPSKPIRDVYFQRSYQMISKQLNCSAAVSVWHGKGSSVKKSPQQPSSRRFMDQFENFFQTFIPPERINAQPLRKRKSSSSSHRPAKQKSQRQSHESGGSQTAGEELRVVRGRRQASFYGKMKERIAERVQPLVDKSNRNKLRRVETRPKSKRTVAEVLKDKQNLKECEPHLRLSRTGLVIRLDSMETKPNQSNLRKIQTLKPKKDKIFQRCLIKNCEIVLENLQNYQQQRESTQDLGETTKENRKGGKEKHKEHRRYNSSILNKTATRPKPTHASSHTQDISLLKMREKCLGIQLTCKKSYKNNRGMQQGLKVFGKYCRKMQKKMQTEEERIDAVMAEEEREEDAGRIYDYMSNTRPMQAYLSNLQ